MELSIERITGSKIWKKIGIPETSGIMFGSLLMHCTSLSFS
jgi:hypothetical protein